MKSVQIEFLGQASFRFEAPGGDLIFLDPWLDANPVCAVSLDAVTRADTVCVTHGPVDHLGDSIELVK